MVACVWVNQVPLWWLVSELTQSHCCGLFAIECALVGGFQFAKGDTQVTYVLIKSVLSSLIYYSQTHHHSPSSLTYPSATNYDSHIYTVVKIDRSGKMVLVTRCFLSTAYAIST